MKKNIINISEVSEVIKVIITDLLNKFNTYLKIHNSSKRLNIYL